MHVDDLGDLFRLAVWDEGSTYVESDVEFVHTTSHDWNHGLGEIVTALLDEGLTITQLVEHHTLQAVDR